MGLQPGSRRPHHTAQVSSRLDRPGSVPVSTPCDVRTTTESPEDTCLRMQPPLSGHHWTASAAGTAPWESFQAASEIAFSLAS